MRRLTPELTRRTFSVIAGTRRPASPADVRSFPPPQRADIASGAAPLPFANRRPRPSLAHARASPARSCLPNVLNEISRCASSSQSE